MQLAHFMEIEAEVTDPAAGSVLQKHLEAWIARAARPSWSDLGDE